MMNLTKNELLIHCSGEELRQKAEDALAATLKGLYEVFDG